MVSKFQKRHYQAIGELLAREVAPVVTAETFEAITHEFARMFKADNGMFKPDKFRNFVASKINPNAWPTVNERRIADRIDGYDRDDLGESPDY
jgi:hypothetical protein